MELSGQEEDAMSVEVCLPEALRRYAKGNAPIELEAGTISTILARLGNQFPELSERILRQDGTLMGHLAVIRRGNVVPEQGHCETMACDGDLLELLFIASGG